MAADLPFVVRLIFAHWQGVRAPLDAPAYPNRETAMADQPEVLRAAALRLWEDLIVPWELVKPLAGVLDPAADDADEHAAQGHLLDLAHAILAHRQPAPAECEAGCRAVNERARADALEARLAVLQERNMAADVAPAGFATEEVTHAR